MPVILQTIEDYKKAGADQLFIEQQEAKLQRVYAMIEELEAKKIRLFNRL